MANAENSGSLREHLTYEPRELRFGTSGRRGLVVDLTQLEVYINALAELQYLQSLPREQGGIVPSEEFFIAYDLRPSSTAYVPEQGGKGEIAQAVVRAIQDAGMKPVNLGCIPTPALTLYGISRNRGSIMVTGSHIPFDRNGYKANTSVGELLKKDEAPINDRVREVRQRVYGQPFAESLFNERGLLKSGHQELPPVTDDGRKEYVQRYTSFFRGKSLRGARVLAYQHSAVGRDILVEILGLLGAEVIPAGRSDTFVPIDTENVNQAQLETIQRLADEAAAKHGPLDAVVSTDGDSDRPLVLGVEPTGAVRFFGGDLVGMIVAEYLGADAVVVPISCNDAIDRGPLKEKLQPKTRIGSPYVIAGMQRARASGKRVVCGWEANGGFLTGSDIERDGNTLRALPTRDAMLPILCALFAAKERGMSLPELFATLPKRFSKAALLPNFPQSTSVKIVQRFSPTDPRVCNVLFEDGRTVATDEHGSPVDLTQEEARRIEGIRRELSALFTPAEGFGPIVRLNYTDGVRIIFANGDVAHVRPSGNADELRIYAVADTQERADAIAAMGVAEPNGILRRMEQAVMAPVEA
jgi:phosphomannomutase